MSSILIHADYPVEAEDYTRGGEASADIKRQLKQLGVPANVLRRVSVASYEVELNLVIHSDGGVLTLEVTPEAVRLISADRGPGSPDVDLAMREGWSTASETARSLGFGAGMGLPNMKRNADDFDIQSEMGKGTRISMRFNLA